MTPLQGRCRNVCSRPPGTLDLLASRLIAAGREGLAGGPGDTAVEAPEVPSMQHPILAGLAGGIAVDFDAQERAAWGALADACDVALTSLHPQHPERHHFRVMLQECRRAAGQQLEPARLQMA